MRIAQLTYSTRPRGGVVHTLALAEALAARGHEVTVVTLGRGGDDTFFRSVDPAVTLRVIPFESRGDESVGERILRSIGEIGRGFDARGFDVVHAQDCISANAVDASETVLVRTIHHLDQFSTPELIACHERAIVRPRARLSVSAAVAAEVEAGWGLRPTVIANGVDAARFAAAASPASSVERDRWRGELGRYVLALGGIEPRKGSIDLLEAFARVRVAHPEISLVFGGGETLFDYRDYRAEFERRCFELGIAPIVLGTVAEERLAPLVAAADALGFVSTKEGFGLAAMEALAAGVPVVARRLPVIEEVFGDTVGYGDDVASIAAALGRALGGGAQEPSGGRALAESHSWSDAARLHERFYEAVLRSGGDHGASIDLADPQLAR
ncbi:MSMEG_0565 family glycosyltransferase [Microbacteriaceae bacterium VKM Ac-2855]|nr:MSMEG_0565 family glycosyltransferase [Microbacteriaceae bacterium VKM Ac-2855]